MAARERMDSDHSSEGEDMLRDDFVGVKTEDLEAMTDYVFSESNASACTVKATHVAVKMLREYCQKKKGRPDFENFPIKELNQILVDFLTTTRRKDGTYYSRSTVQCFRASVGRYLLKAFGINMAGPEFDHVNTKFKEHCRYLKHIGLDKIKNVPTMKLEDLRKLYNSSALAESTPWGLQNKVFVDIMLFSHVNTGRESLRAMTTKTLDFGVDTNGREYVTIPSRLNKKDEYNDKVVLYAAPGFVKCPIRSFKKYMAKLNPDSELFWQRPKRVTFEITEECPVWYQDAPVGHNSLRTYIATLSSEADLSQGYTNQSVRLAAASLKEGKVTDSLASEVLSIIAPKQVQSVATQNNNGMVTLVLCNPGNQPGQVFTSNNAVRQSSSTQPSFMIQRPPQTTYHQAGNTRQLTALPNAPQFSTQSISHSLQQSEKYMPQQHVMSSSLQQNTASNQASMSSNGQQMIPTSIHPMVPQVKNTSRPTHGAIPSFSASFLPQATSIPPPSVSQQLNASNASQSDNASVSTTTRASQQKSNTVCTWVVNPHSNAVLPMNSKDKQPGTQPVLLNHQTQTEKVIMTNKGIQADLAAENHTARGNAHVSDTNLYKCDACGISFNNAMVHAMHQSLHAKEEPFQCSMCRKSFSNTVEFNGHIFSSHQ